MLSRRRNLVVALVVVLAAVVVILAVGTHMHYVGTDMRIGVKRPVPGGEPAEECLLDTPKWDFNWQRGYRYDVPIDQAPTLKAGDVLNLRCTYDNSMQNGFVSPGGSWSTTRSRRRCAPASGGTA